MHHPLKALDHDIYEDIRERTYRERLEANELAKKNAMWLAVAAAMLVACYLTF